MARRKRLSRRALRRAGVSVAALIVMTGAVSWIVGGQLVSPAPSSVGTSPADLDAETVSIASESGSTLGGWYIRGAPDKGTVVLLHGIHESRLQMIDRARLLTRRGYSSLLIDFQAHGESPGRYISIGHLERLDVRAAVAFARERRPGQPVAVIGVSLGGAAAILAHPLDIDAAVVESAYPTIDEAVGNRIRTRIGPLSPIAKQLLLVQLKPRLGVSTSQLRPIDHIGEIGCPVLVMSGSDDRDTTPAETRRLFEAAREPKQLALFDGAAHVDLYESNATLYADLVLGFLAEHLDQK